MYKKIAITLVIVLLVAGSFLLWTRYFPDRHVEHWPSTHHTVEVDQSRPSDEELSMDRAVGVQIASEDWEKKSVYLISQGDEEEGTTADGYKFRYRFHREIGFRFNRIYGGHVNRFSDEAMKLGYDAWVREKVKKEGVPEWSHREQVPPLDVMADYLKGKKPMTLVDKLPFQISEKIYLRRAAKKYLGDHFTRVELVFEDSYEVMGIDKVTGEGSRKMLDSFGPFNVHPHDAEGMPIYFTRFERHPETMIFRVGDVLIRVMVGEQIIAQLRKNPPPKDDKKPMPDKTK